jgi:hypothetical protein
MSVDDIAEEIVRRTGNRINLKTVQQRIGMRGKDRDGRRIGKFDNSLTHS